MCLRLTTRVTAQNFSSIGASLQKRVTQTVSLSVRGSCSGHYAINNFCFAGIADDREDARNDALFRRKRFQGEINGTGDFPIAPGKDFERGKQDGVADGSVVDELSDHHEMFVN